MRHDSQLRRTESRTHFLQIQQIYKSTNFIGLLQIRPQLTRPMRYSHDVFSSSTSFFLFIDFLSIYSLIDSERECARVLSTFFTYISIDITRMSSGR